MPMPDRLLAYRSFVDRIERQRNLNQFLSNWSGHFGASMRSGWWVPCPRHQLCEAVIDAGHPEIRLTPKRLTGIVDAMLFADELDDRQNEILRLIQRVEDLVARHCDRVGARDAPFDLDEAQLSGAGHAAFDVVAELLHFAIDRLEAEPSLNLHDDLSGACRGCWFLLADD